MTPEKWRLLEPGEIIQLGDEIFRCNAEGAGWFDASAGAGAEAGDFGFSLWPVRRRTIGSIGDAIAKAEGGQAP